ncbi:MAG: sigma-70 family RNA polymerase sigma factor [Planctomycetales bacterium]|nr:sigma-70 family RNA polymerase sigma factor [Planctomycetales bacterium]
MNDDLNQPDPHEQFVALYVEHQVAIRSFVRTLLPNAADAEDVMQTASLTMWRRFAQFQPGTSFRNWAFQVAKFTVMKHVARKARDRHRFSDETIELLAQHVEQYDERLAGQRRALQHCVQRLGDDDRQVLAVCYSTSTPLKEFAAQLGRTPNALYKQLGRIRASLVVCVQRRLEAEGFA